MLTDTKCRNAKPTQKPYKLFDYSGLYLEVMPNGGRYWRLKYRFFNKEKRLALGIYPIVSLQEAREKRDAAKKQLAGGEDPGMVKREERKLARYKAEQTFEVVAREWHSRNKRNWSTSHADTILYRLELDVFPSIGRNPIQTLLPKHLLSCVQKIEDRGAHEMARRALSMCGQVFRYAVLTGRAQRDITVDLKGALKRVNKGHYAAIEVDELPDFIKALNSPNSRLFVQTRLAIKLMLLTFVRTRELLEAKWSEFNLEKAEWNIPAERMKMRQPHFVPLAKQAIALLQELRQLNGLQEKQTEDEKDLFIFPSITKRNKPMSNNTILSGLDSLKYKGRMTGHGFRALAMSTIKEKLGYQHEVIDRQLAHLPISKVDRAYDRAKFIPQRKKMMQQWADYTDKIGKKHA